MAFFFERGLFFVPGFFHPPLTFLGGIITPYNLAKSLFRSAPIFRGCLCSCPRKFPTPADKATRRYCDMLRLKNRRDMTTHTMAGNKALNAARSSSFVLSMLYIPRNKLCYIVHQLFLPVLTDCMTPSNIRPPNQNPKTICERVQNSGGTLFVPIVAHPFRRTKSSPRIAYVITGLTDPLSILMILC